MNVSVAATPYPARWRALAALLIGSFMVLLDTSIVTNGLATIQRDLNATYSQVQFVLTAYSVAYGMLLVTGGRLGDLLGRRRMFLLGLVGFTLASVLCGLSQSPLMLILFRILQGMCGALLFPQVSSYIQVLFPLEERPRAFGIQGSIIGLGIVTGPLLGGILIDANLWHSLWRPIFLVNVPIGVFAFAFAARVLPESRSPVARRLDLFGVLLLSTALFLLIYPIIQGRDAGWPLWLVAMLTMSVPLLGIFLVQQSWLDQRGGSPLVYLKLFRSRVFALGALITFLFQASVLSYFVTMSLLFQAGLGYSPTKSAVTLITYQIAIAVASLLSARLSRRLGRAVLLLGFAMLSVGLVGTLLILNRTALTYHGYELIPTLLIGGLGFGFVVAPLQTLVLAGVDPVYAGSASGILSTIQQVASALGVAIIGIVLFGQLAAGAATASGQVTPSLTAELSALHLPQQASQVIVTQFSTCFHDRSSQSDPNAIPASCQRTANTIPPQLAQPLNRAIAHAAAQARASNFLAAALITMRFQLIIYALCFLLIWGLPRRQAQRSPTTAIQGARTAQSGATRVDLHA